MSNRVNNPMAERLQEGTKSTQAMNKNNALHLPGVGLMQDRKHSGMIGNLILMGLIMMMVLTLLPARPVAAQALPSTWKIIDMLTAVYPNGNTENDSASYWALESTGQQLTLHWEQYGHRIGDSERFYVYGTADELPGKMVVFISNGQNNHGAIAFVVEAE